MSTWKSKRKVMHRYNVTAEIYDERYSEEQKKKYKKTLENIEVIGAGILDVGCGSGLFFSQVASRAEMVVGVDVSHKLLLKAKEHAAGNVFVVEADADHLPFSDHRFSLVFAFTVLQNMPKPAKTLEEVKRVAKVGDRVIVTGLKKVFPIGKFMDILEESGMRVVAFVDEEAINCYIAVLAT